MNITTPGKITDHIYLLGRPESCLYLLDGGNECWFVGGAMAYVVPDISQQIDNLSIDGKRITRIIILHAHFDHCGAVPYLKRRWPEAAITSSPRAKDLLSDPSIFASVKKMNNAALADRQLEQSAKAHGFYFDEFKVEKTIAQGDQLNCGSLDVSVLDVPGHSSCSIALYLPSEKALFASDAVGIKYKGVFQPTPNANFDMYQKSLQKLRRYEVKSLLLEHFGAFMGEEAETFISNAIASAAETRRLLEETYLRTRDVERCTKEITEIFLSRDTDAFLPDEIRAIVAGQMVRYIAKVIEEREQ